ncbi:MAG: DEAD/DEAH box helicase [Euryarchaeota archaeon]|nr:DEAD/DEAH box helicase [Euryarchaeota archaeon]
MAFVSHPLIRPELLEERVYQANISRVCVEQSTLVVLPTGMGKTVIATRVIAEVLRRKGGRALFLAPTKPLVEQHAGTMRQFLTVGPVTMFTGELAPAERAGEWEHSPVIVSTPQVILNDLISGTLSLDDFNLIIFDEAHRAVGNYAYVFIAEKYRAKGGLALGITASPGSTAARILEVCKNLDMQRVEIRREHDPDVRPYVHDIRVHWLTVEVPPEMMRVLGFLRSAFKRQVKFLQDFGLLRKGERHSMKELLEAQRTIRQRMAQAAPRPPQALFRAAAVQAAAVQINHALELIETQGTAALRNYLDRMEEKATGRGPSRSASIVMKDEDVIKARYLANHLELEHPKLEKVCLVVGSELRRNPRSRVIVFTHYRDTSELVAARLEKVAGCRPARFVGQATRGEDEGLSQKEQAELIEKFKRGEFNTLVATSVGEEGLDIPSTELVVFYEPVPSEIRTIQRRGRTGRKMPGKVVILMARGTRDEHYFWSARNKERKMMQELETLRRQLARDISVGFPQGGAPEEEFRPSNGCAPEEAEAGPAEESNGPEEAAPGPADAASGDQGPRGALPTPSSGPAGDGDFRRRAIEILEGHGFGGPPRAASAAGAAPGTEAAERKRAFAPAGQASAPGALSTKGQRSLGDFPEEAPEPLTIIVDHREFNSGVVRELSRGGARVLARQLPVGDFILSDRVAAERKEVKDFVGSLLGGRLFGQVRDLKGAYARPLLVIEGENLFGAGGVSQESILGTLASIVTDFGIPTVFTRDERETAGLLLAIAKRELAGGRAPAIRGEKGSLSLPERQQFIVEGLPHVSGTLSQRLLAQLGSVYNVFNAGVEELARVKGVGRKTAEELYRTVRSPYLSVGPGGERDKQGDGREEE